MLLAAPLLLAALTQQDALVLAYVEEGRGDARAIAAQLRSELGPTRALEVVWQAKTAKEDPFASSASPSLERWRVLVDMTAAQKDAWASHLAWHTDLEAAKKEAQQTKKPILSLRLLGRLDEDLSCANSRFFRTLLYPDPAVREHMKGFVLHWQTVRPAPKLTIDMGDGRVMTTTITGNSAHLVLDEQGRVLDAIPGMVSPLAFTKMLTSAQGMFMNAPKDRQAAHARFRRVESRDWTRLAGFDKALPVVGKSALKKDDQPLAMDAGPMAMTKAAPEMPVLRALSPVDASELRTDPIFDLLATNTKGNVRFSDEAKQLVARKLAPTQKLDVVLARLQQSVAKDTIINQMVLHDAVRAWLERGENDATVVQERLYDELFLTPKADPWLGLVDESAYFGIERGGLK